MKTRQLSRETLAIRREGMRLKRVAGVIKKAAMRGIPNAERLSDLEILDKRISDTRQELAELRSLCSRVEALEERVRQDANRIGYLMARAGGEDLVPMPKKVKT